MVLNVEMDDLPDDLKILLRIQHQLLFEIGLENPTDDDIHAYIGYQVDFHDDIKFKTLIKKQTKTVLECLALLLFEGNIDAMIFIWGYCYKIDDFANVIKISRHNVTKLPYSVNPLDNNFLHSGEWRNLKYKFRKMHDNKCMCCGQKPSQFTSIFTCVDHIKCRKQYPNLALDITNLQILCNECNHGKGNTDDTNFKPFKKFKGKQITYRFKLNSADININNNRQFQLLESSKSRTLSLSERRELINLLDDK